ncbi:terminase large subunit domain-containing protein [Ruegeria atlantica]|uniref:terminase large subunit domain-containing protein n=1 Tax=Ruegeria atlantica TaxID=81569 RepID=UPI00147A5EED|nr:terminase family protein [Ruegeria atlantica]
MPFDALVPWCEDLERSLDPSARLAHWIGHRPDQWQLDAFLSKSSEVALRVCRQAGKTSVLAARAVEELHVPESLTICIAPAERQSKIIAREISRQLRKTYLNTIRPNQTEIEMSNGARVVALPGSSDTIRGYSAVSCLIIDECAFLKAEMGDDEGLIASVLPMLTKDGQVFFSSTPAGRDNYFARLFIDDDGRPRKGDDVHRIVVRGTDIPRMSDKVERMRRIMSATKFRQEIECELLADGQAYFAMDVIEAATSKEAAVCPIL